MAKGFCCCREHEEQGEVIHYDNVAIPEIHLPHKK